MRMSRVDEFSVSAIIRYQGARRDDAGQMINDPIADELTRAMAGRGHVPAATAIVTGAGELRHNGVHYVVHVASVQGEPGAGYRQIREVGRCVTNVLTEIERLPVRTVLFPLLGAGQGGAEPRPTAHALVGAAIDYFTAVPTTRLTSVFFLAYKDIELAACEAACVAHRLVRVGDTAMVSLPPAPATQVADSARTLRLGVVVDIVGYGRRAAPEQEAAQQRLSVLARRVLHDAGVEFDAVDHQWTGDGFALFLPSDIDPAGTLSALLSAIPSRLAEDNEANGDRIRLRMAVGVGLVRVAATGFAGTIIVDINRLVDSAPLRDAVHDHPHSDVVVLLSQQTYASLVRPGYLRPPDGDFQRVRVTLKEFHEPAWLWVAPPANLPR